MEDYLSKLNDQQREAVTYTDSAQLVIAGAGSGKTRVLTYKIVHLLANGYRASRILALTFTNKAAREMRERITAVLGDNISSKLWMGTFHSMFLRMLHQHYDRIGYRANFTIYDSNDSRSLIKLIIKNMDLDDKIYKPSVVQNAISMAKNAMVSPEQYANDRQLRELDARAKRPLIYAIYQAYNERCVVANAMDFDDILYYTNKLLTENPEIRNHYREFFQYVLVDEYQDTNKAQHLIIQNLTEGQNNLTVVGDDAQSIYSFRGANIGNILTLKHHYPDLRIHKLERNYRSTQNIIEAASSLINKNVNQIPKHIFSENEKGKKITVLQSYSDYEEGYLIANRISQNKMLEHDSFADYAILYRTNAQSRILEEALRKRNIPYRILSGLSFYQRKEVKDAIAYFKLAVNPSDDESLRRIINYPARGIGDTTLNKITSTAMSRGCSLWDTLQPGSIEALPVNSGTMKKLLSFRDLIQSFIDRSQGDAYELAADIFNKTGIKSLLVSDRTPESISKIENLDELLNSVRIFIQNQIESGRADNTKMVDYLSEVALITDNEDEESTVADSVTLMTVHSAKGLEFKNVYIVGVEEELFPSSLSSGSAEELEEERRLMYVALTRAKKRCVISYAQSRYINGETRVCKPSRFINEINPSYLDFSNVSFRNRPEMQTYINPVANYRRTTAVYPSAKSGYSRETPAREKSFSEIKGGSERKAVSATGNTEFRLHRYDEIEEGVTIEHSRFGRGIVKEKKKADSNEMIVVEFNNVETKTLLLKFARFKIIKQA